MNTPNAHLDSDTLQGYLEGELPEARLATVEAHLAGCPRCAAELEGWQVLMSELDDLPALAPSMTFGDRVMAGIRTAEGSAPESVPALVPERAKAPSSSPAWWRRLLPWSGGRGVMEGDHLAPGILQDLLDGALPGQRLVLAREHLNQCTHCRGEMAEWESLFTTLEAIPHLGPSPGFADRVMAAHAAAARTPAPVPAGLERVLDWADKAARAGGRFLPATPRSWGLLGALAAIPSLALVAAVGAVVAHPLVSWGALATFLRWRVGDWVGTGGAWVSQQLLGTPLATTLWDAAAALAAAPGAALALVMGAWTLSVAAAWILYRNVLAPPLQVSRHE
ncbi:MAG: hypothetical protein EA422_01760 [Gemmatimonadales bacterium]|nr:MAG: hypothetical protein EA422_01760 [Gemmatimonadales bacterium]